MILPPTNVSEFVVFRASASSEYEVFVFQDPILPILVGYESGTAIPPTVTPNVKSFLFAEEDEFASRESLQAWLRKVGMEDPEAVANKCSSWRLVHCQVPGVYYPPKYQGHPVREQDWERAPTLIRRAKTTKRDIFDPLTWISDDPTFSGSDQPF